MDPSNGESASGSDPLASRPSKRTPPLSAYASCAPQRVAARDASEKAGWGCGRVPNSRLASRASGETRAAVHSEAGSGGAPGRTLSENSEARRVESAAEDVGGVGRADNNTAVFLGAARLWQSSGCGREDVCQEKCRVSV